MKMKIKEPKTYSKKTLSALKRSVKHWEENLDANHILDIQIYEDDCPLCAIFGEDDACKGCPIRDYTGKPDCLKTPWEKVRNEYDNNLIASPGPRLKNAIIKELDFLKMLYEKLSSK
jgi:hypothetical protein